MSTTEHDPKTISWKAAFDLIIVAEAVKVVSHNNELVQPRCDVDELKINLYLPHSQEHKILYKHHNNYASVDNEGNLWFVVDGFIHERIGIRLLNASPVIVP